jgi:heat shock protein HtpX
MAMNFWEAQKRARSRTGIFLFVFIFLTFLMAGVSEVALRYFAGQENYNPPLPYFGLLFLAITFLTAGFQYWSFKMYGGRYVAEAVGGVEVDGTTTNRQAQQLLNIVQEMSIASSLPMPAVYIIPSNQINAFAAGLTPDKAAIAVTVGAIQQLNRDELQGVIGHEFGHLYNGDAKISLRLAAMVMGFTVLLYLGLRLIQGGMLFGGGDDDRGDKKNSGQIVILAAVILLVAGAITWFGGAILKSLISREREYLADACAVQFTRNPNGIANALRKIAQDNQNDMPKTGMAYNHLYFNHRSTWDILFATHPPIEKRIAAIEGKEYMPEEWKS